MYGLLISFFLRPTLLTAQKVQIEKEPLWVTVNTIDYSNTNLDKDAEDGYIDVDYEKQISVEQQCVYYRRAEKIISESGIQNVSQISQSYDPSYEQLVFHTIKIIRDGKTINKLEPSKFKVIQQETELSRSIYNGNLSAVLILEDVRKGDVIEYSYSIKGFNPILRGKFAENLSAGFSVPVYNMYYKLISSNKRNLTIKNSLTNVQPIISKTANENIYEWKFNDINAIHEEDMTPSWYDPYPAVMISEFKSWKEINDWAVALFPKNITLSSSLKQKTEELRAAGNTDEERVLTAIKFVQDDVRYMGIEMGENSHKPNNPNKIFAQRFGDCKDKSYLLCTILRTMGIEANPVLINTDYKKQIQNWLPTPYAFDHTTVQIKLADKIYWIDPTISYQRGKLNDISFPDYQIGLVLTDTTTNLTHISLQDKGMVKTKEVFTVPTMYGKVRLDVTTEYTGSYADNMREQFKDNSVYGMQKSFLNFYISYYDETSIADSLEVKDDESKGMFTITEHYDIDNFWSDEKDEKKVSFSAFLINSVIKKPKDIARKMPVSVDYPAHYIEDIEINLPETWDAEKSQHHLSCAAFNLNSKFDSHKNKITLHYDYETLKDFVSPEESKDFIADCAEFSNKLGYQLTYDTNINNSNETKASFPPLLTFLMIGGSVVALVWWTQKRRS